MLNPINVFNWRSTGFHGQAKFLQLNFFIRKTCLNGQTRQPESPSQPVNLPGAQPQMKHLNLC